MIHVPHGLRIDPSWTRALRHIERHRRAGRCPSCLEYKEVAVHRVCARCHADEKKRGAAMRKQSVAVLSREQMEALSRELADLSGESS
jgi:hypothetical protein